MFGVDPEYQNVKDRTERIAATVNGDTKWMLQCTPKFTTQIDCNDGHTYERKD